MRAGMAVISFDFSETAYCPIISCFRWRRLTPDQGFLGGLSIVAAARGLAVDRAAGEAGAWLKTLTNPPSDPPESPISRVQGISASRGAPQVLKCQRKNIRQPELATLRSDHVLIGK
jgi:hypothetical protein